MTICVDSLDICLRIPAPRISAPKADLERLTGTNASEWADHLPYNPEALLEESRQKGLEISSGINLH